MLTHTLKTAAAALLGLFLLTAAPGTAWAECWEEHREVCPPTGGDCVIEVIEVCDDEGESDPGGGSGGGGGGGETECTWNGQTVDCYKEGLGWFNPSNGCYYLALDPQPPAGDGRWGEGDPETDTVYQRRCILGTGGYDFNFEALTAPPPGYGEGGGFTPEQVAQMALELLPITGPAVGTAPDPAGEGLVGLPVWIWTDETPETWGPISRTASAGGISVTATATADHITWDMGDGGSVTCDTPGTPYEERYGGSESPDCGYRYETPGEFTVTGTTAWTVNWQVNGGGATGVFNVTRSSSVDLVIEEAQAVR
jgi:hypothetical protein